MKKPKKSLSQNFLNDKNISNKITNLIEINNKNILEIGPGYGSLTDFIIKKNPKKLVLVEKDYNIYEYLKIKYKNYKNIELLNQDIIDFDFKNFKNLNIISNLPYNISTKIIFKLLKLNENISEMVFMIQKEVSLKIDYNKNKLNKYKFFTKISSDYQRCFNVPPSVFTPKPKVVSTVVKFKLNKFDIDWNKVENFSNKMFKNKRKKISNKLVLSNTIINNFHNKRVEELNINELINIYDFF